MTKEALPHTPGRWRLIYFDAPTRGEQIRVLFALAGVAFDDVRVRPFPSGLDPYKKAALGDAGVQCARTEEVNVARTALVSTYNGAVSPMFYLWYQRLDRIWPGNAPLRLARKVVVNQLVTTSINSPK